MVDQGYVGAGGSPSRHVPPLMIGTEVLTVAIATGLADRSRTTTACSEARQKVNVHGGVVDHCRLPDTAARFVRTSRGAGRKATVAPLSSSVTEQRRSV